MFIVEWAYMGTNHAESFKTERQAWKRYAGLYSHFLDAGNAEMFMKNADGGVLYYDSF